VADNRVVFKLVGDQDADSVVAEPGRQRRNVEYDPYDDPDRAVKEEFGDLLAEGLYARLDHEQGLHGVDTPYWEAFIKNRTMFLAS
jgi:hypothetical protein